MKKLNKEYNLKQAIEKQIRHNELCDRNRKFNLSIMTLILVFALISSYFNFPLVIRTVLFLCFVLMAVFTVFVRFKFFIKSTEGFEGLSYPYVCTLYKLIKFRREFREEEDKIFAHILKLSETEKLSEEKAERALRNEMFNQFMIKNQIVLKDGVIKKYDAETDTTTDIE